ncbi:MAG: MotA/TolQ/ExbB proton channel family protein [Phycisphaeraceae bacterium]|nr:MotA/TolQ/ExbB proton channel family protein [Phycisphaeraceae bacterium]
MSCGTFPLAAVDAPRLLLAAAPGSTAGRTLLQYIGGGGLIGYVIIGLSVMAVGLVVLHMIQIRRSRLAPPEVVEALSRYMRENDVPGAIQFCRQETNDCFVTRVFGAALTRCGRSSFGLLELRSAIEDSGRQEVDAVGRSIDGVSLIAAIAPMLGLLGTVVGMVRAFETISATQGMARPADLAGHISIALVTTVQGLVVAIPCTAAYSYFRGRIERLATEIAETIEGLAGELEAASGRAPVKPGARPVAAKPPAGSPKEARAV